MKKILIIEDEESIAELQKDYLEMSNYHVEVQYSGKKGLQRAMEEDFDLIILDVMIPEVSGFDICKKVRAIKNIPILFVSARKEDIDKIRGLGLGADDYITKPFSPSELVARVNAHLSRFERLLGKSNGNNLIYLHGISIDKISRKVYVDGKQVNFTTKEFDLLVFFALNPNQVLSKEQIYERIWGFDSAADVSTVTVHISKIREKIEKDPSQPLLLETIWGSGYRFNL